MKISLQSKAAFSLLYSYAEMDILSIVAVHGLNGDPIESWKHPKTNAIWIKDFLPQDVPNVRVMSIGYNASTAFGSTTASIIDHAKDLLGSLVDKREEDDASTWSE